MKTPSCFTARGALCATLFAAIAFVGSGCSSIVHGGNRNIVVNSNPSGATVTVYKADTREAVHSGTTPLTLTLDPKGGYFRGQAYTLKFELTRHKTTEIQLRPQLSGWYFGNIIFGGLIGMIVVDPLTGAMWNLSPEKIEQPLTSEQAAIINKQEGFVVVMIPQLTDSEKAGLVRIN